MKYNIIKNYSIINKVCLYDYYPAMIKDNKGFSIPLQLGLGIIVDLISCSGIKDTKDDALFCQHFLN